MISLDTATREELLTIIQGQTDAHEGRKMEVGRLRAALTLIADKDKTPLYRVNVQTGESKQIGWGHGTAGSIAVAALDNQQNAQEK